MTCADGTIKTVPRRRLEPLRGVEHTCLRGALMGKRTCSFDACHRLHNAHGLCTGHYAQEQLGKPLTPLKQLGHSWARDDVGRKFCTRCLDWLPVAEFGKEAKREDGLSHYCKRCVRNYRLQCVYGVTIDQYEAMFAAQRGKCGICKTADLDGRIRHFHVDHDHACCPGRKSCGRCVRGLLCPDCNLVLGIFTDDIARFEAAIDYLKGALK